MSNKVSQKRNSWIWARRSGPCIKAWTSSDAQFSWDFEELKWWSRGYEYAWALKALGPREMVLDAGCGDRPFPFLVAEVRENSFVVGVDPAAPKFSPHVRVRYISKPIQEVEDEELDEVDAAVSLSVLEHLKGPGLSLYLSSISRALSPGDPFLITMDVGEGKIPAGGGWNGINDLLEKAGFSSLGDPGPLPEDVVVSPGGLRVLMGKTVKREEFLVAS